MWFLVLCIFARIFWGARETLMKQPPASRLFTQAFIRTQIKETSKLRVTGLCEGNSPVTGEFPAQRANDTEMFPFDDVIMNFERTTDAIWLLGPELQIGITLSPCLSSLKITHNALIKCYALIWCCSKYGDKVRNTVLYSFLCLICDTLIHIHKHIHTHMHRQTFCGIVFNGIIHLMVYHSKVRMTIISEIVSDSSFM